MYFDLVPRSAVFPDKGTERREEGAVADWEVEQYRNNRAGSATVVLNILERWGYIFQKCRRKRTDTGYHSKKNMSFLKKWE